MPRNQEQRTNNALYRWLRSIFCFTVLLSFPLWLLAEEPRFLEEPFEAKGPKFIAGPHDADYKEIKHDLTSDSAHNGQKSELIHIQSKQGNYAHYVYPIERAAIAEELEVSLWIKASRPGARVMARVVLPHERDEKNINRPLTTLIRGDRYKFTGRWERLELREPVKALQEQQRLLQAATKRKVNIADAYIDQVIVDVYSGPGATRVWIDDMEVGPMLSIKKQPPPVAVTPGGKPGTMPVKPVPSPEQLDRRLAGVKLMYRKLLHGDKPVFIRGIRHTGTPLKTLRDAGFNTVWLNPRCDEETLAQATKLGFYLVPTVPQRPLVAKRRGEAPGVLTSRFQLMRRQLNPFLKTDAVLFWDLGAGLASEQYSMLTSRARDVRAVDPMRPVAVDVWDGFQKYSQGIDQVLVGAHRWPLMTSFELPRYREWIEQRLRLSHPGTYSWTWIQTHLPNWYSELIYGQNSSKKFNEPIGPQPEQIRLLTYTALAAGIRGLGFWSDRFLADSHKGRDRLLQLALLNLELQLLEPLLLSADTPRWIKTSDKNVKAAVMRTDKGILVLPIWVGSGSQYVPGQAARANLEIVVPIGQGDRQPWLVTPGEVRALRSRRTAGGTAIQIPEFGLTTAVVFTGDLGPNGLIVRFQNRVRSMRRIAAQWSHDLAKEELAKVSTVYQQIASQGYPLPDGEALLKDARRRIQRSATYRRNGDARRAYHEAQRALRPLRILMRAQWSKAVAELETPTASPYIASYYTLPRHWRFREEISRSFLTQNVIPDGGFEKSANQRSTQWRLQEVPSLDEVKMSARREQGGAHSGKQSLCLEIKPKYPKNAPAALERSFIALHSPAVKLTPGTLVRITVWAKLKNGVSGSVDGAMIYDSAGGEPLAVRMQSGHTKWTRYTLFRRVPASGTIHVTLALTGMGKVYFDDVSIEPLRSTTSAMAPRPAPEKSRR